ncbi:MAG: hypothetical protein HY547_07670 [Elusimicrobia bacterium]|nr:hypothetical protein [Elusimicrobiota bacterium]
MGQALGPGRLFVSDFIVVVCLIFGGVSLGVVYWAVLKLRAIAPPPVKTPAEEILAPQADPGAVPVPIEIEGRLQRLERTIRTLDLSHVEALKILGGRLDQIELTLERLAQASAARFETMERRLPPNESQKDDNASDPPYIKSPSNL